MISNLRYQIEPNAFELNFNLMSQFKEQFMSDKFPSDFHIPSFLHGFSNSPSERAAFDHN